VALCSVHLPLGVITVPTSLNKMAADGTWND